MTDFETRSVLYSYINDRDMPHFRHCLSDAFMHGFWVGVVSRSKQWTDGAQVCPTCWDPYGQVAQDPDCPECGGSGYVDSEGVGFQALRMVRCHYGAYPSDHRREKSGNTRVVGVSLWLEYQNHELEKGDIVIIGESDNLDNPYQIVNERDRLGINEVTNIFLSTTGDILAQQVRAETIDPRRMEYDLAT